MLFRLTFALFWKVYPIIVPIFCTNPIIVPYEYNDAMESFIFWCVTKRVLLKVSNRRISPNLLELEMVDTLWNRLSLRFFYFSLSKEKYMHKTKGANQQRFLDSSFVSISTDTESPSFRLLQIMFL